MKKCCDSVGTNNKVIVLGFVAKAALAVYVSGNCSIYFEMQFIKVASSLCPLCLLFTTLTSPLGSGFRSLSLHWPQQMVPRAEQGDSLLPLSAATLSPGCWAGGQLKPNVHWMLAAWASGTCRERSGLGIQHASGSYTLSSSLQLLVSCPRLWSCRAAALGKLGSGSWHNGTQLSSCWSGLAGVQVAQPSCPQSMHLKMKPFPYSEQLSHRGHLFCRTAKLWVLE